MVSVAHRGAQLKPPIAVEQKYGSPVCIDENKVNELKQLITFIPEAYHPFYESLSSKHHEGESDAEFLDSDEEEN